VTTTVGGRGVATDNETAVRPRGRDMIHREQGLVNLEAVHTAASAARSHAVGGPIRDPLLRRMLALADAIGVTGSVLLLAAVGSHSLDAGLWSLFTLPLWLVLAKLHGLYDRDRHALRHLTVDELGQIFAWTISGTIATALVLSTLPITGLTLRGAVLLSAVTATSVFLLRSVGRWLWRRVTEPERVVILGEGDLAEAVVRKLELFPDIHAELSAIRPAREIDPSGYEPELEGVDRLIVASPKIDETLIVSLLAFCRSQRAKLTVVPPARGMFGTAVQLSHVADLPVLEFNTVDISRSTLLLKQTFDSVVSIVALLVLAPLFIAIAAAIWLDSRGPVVFTQERAGRGGRPFRIYKFRTMVACAPELLTELVSLDDLPEPVFKLRDDPRTTRVGRFLRRASLDELPQLVNVLKGEMSLVGPRPEQVELVERYSENERFRLMVKPGLTGPMQISGRGDLTLQERLAVEREYIENLSIGRDMMIIAHTLSPLVTGKGAF